MVSEIVQAFEEHFSKEDLTLQIPHVLSNIVTEDATIELVTSNNLCPTQLIYWHEFITDKVAHIFINTKCGEEPDLKYPKAEQIGNIAKKLFSSSILDFQNVQTHEDKPKHEIVQILDNVKEDAK